MSLLFLKYELKISGVRWSAAENQDEFGYIWY
jgi:hypothetical protein